MTNRPILTIALALLLSTTQNTFAAEAETPPGVMDTYFCTYNANKDRDDLLAARDYFVKQTEKAGIATVPSFVWHPSKGNVPYDFLWMSRYENLGVYAKSADDMAASEDVSAAMARFDQVASCTSSLAWTRQVFAGSAADDITAPAHIASYACHFNPGIGRDALGDLSNHIRGVMGASDAFKGYASYGLVPITGDADRPDYVVFNVTDNAQGWATGQKAIYTTEGGQSLLRHFNTILDCSTAIWTGERVIGEG